MAAQVFLLDFLDYSNVVIDAFFVPPSQLLDHKVNKTVTELDICYDQFQFVTGVQLH